MTHSHQHPSADQSLTLAIILNVLLTIGEVAAGLFSGSLALLSDATHNAGDVTGLIMTYAARKLGRRPPSPTYTYGLRRMEIFAALADPTRVRSIYSIRDEERSVGDIASNLDLSEPSVSQHLRRLRTLRIVRMRKDGRFRFYQLDDDHVAILLKVCLEHVQCIPPA